MEPLYNPYAPHSGSFEQDELAKAAYEAKMRSLRALSPDQYTELEKAGIQQGGQIFGGSAAAGMDAGARMSMQALQSATQRETTGMEQAGATGRTGMEQAGAGERTGVEVAGRAGVANIENAGRANVADIEGRYGVKRQESANEGGANVARISGDYGLKETGMQTEAQKAGQQAQLGGQMYTADASVRREELRAGAQVQKAQLETQARMKVAEYTKDANVQRAVEQIVSATIQGYSDDLMMDPARKEVLVKALYDRIPAIVQSVSQSSLVTAQGNASPLDRGGIR